MSLFTGPNEASITTALMKVGEAANEVGKFFKEATQVLVTLRPIIIELGLEFEKNKKAEATARIPR